MQNKLKVLIVILFTALIISNVFFAYKYMASLQTLKQTVEKQKINNNVLSFTQLFVSKVLDGSKEVSFEDRLQLENAVRDMNDKEILNSWQAFTVAKDSAEVQKDFYSLFQLLLNKIAL